MVELIHQSTSEMAGSDYDYNSIFSLNSMTYACSLIADFVLLLLLLFVFLLTFFVFAIPALQILL